jgi:hypothetical protein
MKKDKVFISAAVQMDRKEIIRYLRYLSDVLGQRGVHGEIALYGGAAMILAFDARLKTKDVDAVFKPEQVIHAAANEVSSIYGAPPGWLSNAVEVFISDTEDLKFFMEFPNLRVYYAAPEYLLAMKCMSMRLGKGEHDLADIKLLIKHLAISSAAEALSIVERYYPGGRISSLAKSTVEELFAEGEEA